MKKIVSFLCMALLTTGVALAQDWVGTWAAAAEYTDKGDMPKQMELTNNSVRQVVHVSLGGDVLRLQLSNEFGSDAVIDFDKMIQDPAIPTQMNGNYQSDWLHPNAKGYQIMGERASKVIQ